ncbi:MAG: protein-glutamate O-methyltransferase CheR [Candidatus Nitrosocaldaceae archaeon]
MINKMEEIVDYLYTKGIDLRYYDQSFIKRRIDNRLRVRRLENYEEYIKLLCHDNNEYRELIYSLSINVTEFFRDKDTFYSIGKLPFNTEYIKIWSAGCATGEEAYTLAIIMEEMSRVKGIRYKIFATDRNNNAIEYAKKGVYDIKLLSNISKELLERYFVKYDEAHYKVTDTIKYKIEFNVGDIITSQPSNNFDIIVCRNVLIYFKQNIRDELLIKFHRLLKEKGYLILGRSEIVTNTSVNLYKCIMPLERIYMKI